MVREKSLVKIGQMFSMAIAYWTTIDSVLAVHCLQRYGKVGTHSARV